MECLNWATFSIVLDFWKLCQIGWIGDVLWRRSYCEVIDWMNQYSHLTCWISVINEKHSNIFMDNAHIL